MMLKPRITVVGGLAVGLTVAAALFAAFSAGPSTATSQVPASLTAEDEPTAIHGTSVVAFDLGIPGVSLDAALEALGYNLVLPPTAVAGELDKVIIDETAANDAGKPGLMMRYVSGIRLMIQPGETNLGGLVSQPYAPFEDGRPSAYSISEASGRRVAVMRGGYQGLRKGAQVEVRPRVVWNLNGYTYAIEGPAVDTDVEDLVKVVSATR